MTEVKGTISKKKVVSSKEKAPKAEKVVAKEVAEKPVVEAKLDSKKAVKAPAKAGKRSEKALKEAEEKQVKEERKTSAVDDSKASKPKQVTKTRTTLERRGKKFRKAAEAIEAGKSYGLKEAMDLAAKSSPVKFDATVELHVRLGIDPRQADQNLRDTIVLPAGSGKTVRVAVFADADGVAKAKKAGADIAAADEFTQQLDKGTLDFDILITTPQQMAQLGKYARVLGPKGLMPNPKSGTVTTDLAKAVTEAKAGRLEYRVDSTGIIHVGIGKVSFGGDKLLQNAKALFDSIKANRPASLKGTYVKSIHATTSMGPSVSVDINEI